MSFLDEVHKKLIVSCQALEAEPLHGSTIMSRVALAAKMGGAAGIRANSVADIQAIKNEVPLPIIGIIKKDYDDSDIYITPTLDEALQLASLGVDVIALDATNRVRPKGESLETIVSKLKVQFPNILLMADISNIEEAIAAEKMKFDIVSTTLYGYTPQTMKKLLPDNDFEFLKEVIDVIEIPVIAEGNIITPKHARRVLELGAHSVVVGSAITRPQIITERFVNEISKGD